MTEKCIASAININGAIIVWKRHGDCIRNAVESWIAKAPINCLTAMILHLIF